MATNSKNAETDSSNEKWSKKEQELIETIIECQNEATTRAMTTGKCCNELINMKKGVQYGDRTLKRIANSPGINCSEYHLRRCWNFYRLMTNKDYANADLKTLSNTPSAIYHLARIMNSKILSEDNKIVLVKEIAKKAVADKMTVAHIAIVISLRIQTEEERAGGTKETTEKPPKVAKSIKVINEKSLEQVANSIQRAVKSPLLLKEVMGDKVVCKRILNLMNEGMNFIEKMPDCCHDSATAKAIIDLLHKLSIVAERMKGVQK